MKGKYEMLVHITGIIEVAVLRWKEVEGRRKGQMMERVSTKWQRYILVSIIQKKKKGLVLKTYTFSQS